jgi:prolyl oligopeptidase
MKALSLLLVLMTALPPLAHSAGSPAPDDLWLEDVEGKTALDWVRAQNDESTKHIAGTPQFKAMEERFLAIVDSKDRIPGVSRIGERYYNFWRDKDHPRGIWRRTTLEEYRKATPAWETVLDVDALAAAEKVNWVWEGAEPLSPDYTRCLVRLSRGGSDAAVTREFDLVAKTFVVGGFELPESKSDMTWIDRDHVYVGFAFDSTTMTTSGYPRIVKRWTRGTPLASATPVYEGQATDVSVSAYHVDTPGFERDFVNRGITFYSSETFLVRDGQLVKIDKPDDANAGAWRDWMLITLRSDWTVNGQTYVAGSLLAEKFDDYMAGKRDLQVLFRPSERVSLDASSTTRHHVLLATLDNVRSRIDVLTPQADGTWKREPLPGIPEFGNVSAYGVDARESDDYWLMITDFLTPTSLALGTVGGGAAEKLKQTPSFFDAHGAVVTQHEAVSKDGTRIPYFEVAPKGLKLDGTAPTLLYGYGGFEVSEQPTYSGVRGAGWIERGGVFVLANIRGGGEFGPRWHQGGVKEQRIHCYEDFSAVAKDLITRKVTSPKHLGCLGGSNGGLLVGNMIAQYPNLFGAVVCQAPLLDMRRYHKLLAGASWMGEYGDPDKPDQWAYIQKWSPYQLLRPGVKYPPSLFTASTRDDRVHPGHARRMVHKMKGMGADVTYYENIEGGHGGAATNAQQAFMSALAYTFLWQHLAGSAPVPPSGLQVP